MTTFEEFGKSSIFLGYSGENLVNSLEFDVSAELLPGWDAGLVLCRPDGAVYPAVSSVSDGVLHHDLTETDLHLSGNGKAMLVIFGTNGEIKKSATARTIILDALDLGNEPPPEPIEAWEIEATRKLNAVAEILSLMRQASASAESLPVGSQPTVNFDPDTWHFVFGLPMSGGGASTWAEIGGKPFERLGTTMRVDDGTLDVYISESANPAGGNTLSIG